MRCTAQNFFYWFIPQNFGIFFLPSVFISNLHVWHVRIWASIICIQFIHDLPCMFIYLSTRTHKIREHYLIYFYSVFIKNPILRICDDNAFTDTDRKYMHCEISQGSPSLNSDDILCITFIFSYTGNFKNDKKRI